MRRAGAPRPGTRRRRSRRQASPREAVDRATAGDRVERRAVQALPERRQLVDLHRLAAKRAAARRDAPDRPAAVVAEDISALQAGHRVAAIDEPAGDGAARGVGVLRDRLDQRPGPERCVGEAAAAFVDVPAEVDEPGRRARQPVDLLDLALPDVADPEIARGAVEAVPPRVAQADRDEIGRELPLAHVEPEQLSEQDVRVLRAVLRIAARPTVAEADPQLPVGPELEVAPVVVGVGLLDAEDLLRAPRQRAAVRGAVADDPRRAVAARGVVHVEGPVARVAGRECEPEQSLLAPGDDARAHVEERPPHTTALHDPDATRLLDD